MEVNELAVAPPDLAGGFSVVMGEKVLGRARGLGLESAWRGLWLGHATGRKTSFRPEQRIGAVLATLACGLRGMAPANLVLRHSSAMAQSLGGRFPDQGTMHRWLGQVSAEQAEAMRRHLHDVVREHGRYRRELMSDRMLTVDIDGQGLVARGQRFEHATGGYIGDELDRGFQRYVCYVGVTHEVLDERMAPGNQTLMSALPESICGLNEVFSRRERDQVLLRMDSHGGTVANLRATRQSGYHYLCPLYAYWAVKRAKQHVAGRRGATFRYRDAKGVEHRIRYWVLGRWELKGRGRSGRIRCFATVYHDTAPDVRRAWLVLLSDLKRQVGRPAWEHYQQRSGTIEEYNDQSERAYHLDVMRTGNLPGLNAVHAMIGLCWNLTRWATEDLALPPSLAPGADESQWKPAGDLDLSGLLSRASHSGLRLYRTARSSALEVEDTAETPESHSWQRWLRQPIQKRLRLAG